MATWTRSSARARASASRSNGRYNASPAVEA
jgi:hypothetical protein